MGFIAAEFPPSIKAHGQMSPLTRQKLPAEIAEDAQHIGALRLEIGDNPFGEFLAYITGFLISENMY